MPFKPGHNIGRPKGAPNKTSSSARESVLKVFEMIGGVKAFAAWAEANRGEYYKIHSRLLPKEVELSGTDGGPIQTSIEVRFIGAKKDN